MTEHIQDCRQLQKLLAARIRDRRIRKGCSQKVLAELCGISRPQIAQLERGQLDLRLSVLLALAKAFNATVSDLFRGIG